MRPPKLPAPPPALTCSARRHRLRIPRRSQQLSQPRPPGSRTRMPGAQPPTAFRARRDPAHCSTEPALACGPSPEAPPTPCAESQLPCLPSALGPIPPLLCAAERSAIRPAAPLLCGCCPYHLRVVPSWCSAGLAAVFVAFGIIRTSG